MTSLDTALPGSRRMEEMTSKVPWSLRVCDHYNHMSGPGDIPVSCSSTWGPGLQGSFGCVFSRSCPFPWASGILFWHHCPLRAGPSALFLNLPCILPTEGAWVWDTGPTFFSLTHTWIFQAQPGSFLEPHSFSAMEQNALFLKEARHSPKLPL